MTSEDIDKLEGAELDFAIAEIEKLKVIGIEDSFCRVFMLNPKDPRVGANIIWCPSTNWAQGGPLIEKYQVSLIFWGESSIYPPITAECDNLIDIPGATALLATMRSIVKAKRG